LANFGQAKVAEKANSIICSGFKFSLTPVRLKTIPFCSKLNQIQGSIVSNIAHPNFRENKPRFNGNELTRSEKPA
jgi:hypothetical protein